MCGAFPDKDRPHPTARQKRLNLYVFPDLSGMVREEYCSRGVFNVCVSTMTR